jgi:hypothetical protein
MVKIVIENKNINVIFAAIVSYIKKELVIVFEEIQYLKIG